MATTHYPHTTTTNNNPFWGGEKVPKGDLLSFSPNTLWGGHATKYNEPRFDSQGNTMYTEPRFDSQGNLYKADYVTKHPEILDPFRVHAPMPAPTMPDYAFKSAYTVPDNNINSNNANFFSINDNTSKPSNANFFYVTDNTIKPNNANFFSVTDNTIKPNNAAYESFDPFSPRAQQPIATITKPTTTTTTITKPKEEVKHVTIKPEPEYYEEDNYYEPEPVSLNKDNRTKSATKVSPYDNTYRSKGDSLPIRYPIGLSGKSEKCVRLYQEGFPVILEDIIDREDYINVVKGVNAAIIGALRKKRYSNGVSGVLTVTGIILVVPLIPAMMLEDKKAKKVKRVKQMYLDSINPQFERRGLRWSLYSPEQMVGMTPRLHLEITNLNLLTPEMRTHFLTMKPNTSFTL